MINNEEAKKLKLMLTFIPIIPALMLIKHSHLKVAILVISISWTLAILSFFSKKCANFIYTKGKKLLKIIGDFLAVIVLFIIYIFAVLPTGIIMKITKRDRLSLRKQNAETYWKDIKKEDPNYEYQF